MDALRDFLLQEKQQNKVIYPPSSLIFNALNTTPLESGESRDYWARPLSWT